MSNTRLTSARRIQDKVASRAHVFDDSLNKWDQWFADMPGTGDLKSSARTKVSTAIPSLRLDRVIAFVDANINVDLGVARLAAVAGMSPYYFCRSFKRSTGITPHRYVLQRRMEQAKRLLQEKPAHLLEIARQTGFSDQSQFTRVFHKIVGMTPSRYRKELLELPK